jgi:hypothetical protein
MSNFWDVDLIDGSVFKEFIARCFDSRGSEIMVSLRFSDTGGGIKIYPL